MSPWEIVTVVKRPEKWNLLWNKKGLLIYPLKSNAAFTKQAATGGKFTSPFWTASVPSLSPTHGKADPMDFFIYILLMFSLSCGFSHLVATLRNWGAGKGQGLDTLL